jgi:hypothetical protein
MPALLNNNALSSLLGQWGLQPSQFDSFALAGAGQQLANRDEQLSTLQDYGQGARQQINTDYNTRTNNLQTQLAKNGLLGSSMMFSGGLGIEQARQQSLGSLNDQLLGRKMDVLSQNNGALQALFGTTSQNNLQLQLANLNNANQLKLQKLQNTGQMNLLMSDITKSPDLNYSSLVNGRAGIGRGAAG